MESINVSHTLGQLQARLLALPNERKRAAVRAMNKVMVTARKVAVSDLRDVYHMKASELRPRVKIERASLAKPSARLVFSGTRISVVGRFGMKQIRARRGRGFGVKFSRPPWRLETVDGEKVTPEMLNRAFINRSTRDGRPVVMSRTGRPRTSATVLVAPGVARAFEERGIGRTLSTLVRARWAIVFPQEVRYEAYKALRA